MIENVLDLPVPQMSAIRRSIASGESTQIGGHVSGAVRLFNEEKLLQLGMTEETSDTEA